MVVLRARFRGSMACLGFEVLSDLATGSHSPGLAERRARTLARRIALPPRTGESREGNASSALSSGGEILGLRGERGLPHLPTPRPCKQELDGPALAGCFGVHCPQEKAYLFLTGAHLHGSQMPWLGGKRPPGDRSSAH
uniref:Uncharacterized protein n=1 Tax=Pipistrellus kuhlii TaxID=59472 RepID=A0A7J7WDA0_PIPKU|nr:hypothetical protein mPipKuh1_008086 [Pipistrellus kuhlii]